jgi:D-alanyl-D-alanine carboxypeptidase (penicillin-binding protein 5/6)
VVQRGRVVARVPAVTERAVAAATFWERLDDHLERGWVRFLLVAAALCVLALAFLVYRARRVARRPGASPRGSSPTT